MPVAEIRDAKIRYGIHGSGFPLLLIMGSMAYWSLKFLAHMAETYQVITYDNRGTGNSSKMEKVYTIRDLADDASGILDKIGVEKAYIFGVSQGGMIAQELAINHPDRVKKLVLGCTTAGGEKWILPKRKVLEDMIGIRPEEIPTDYRERGLDWLRDYARKSLARSGLLRGYRNYLLTLPSHDACDRLGKISHPTFVVTGREDPIVPPANSEILGREIPNSILRKYSGGHDFVSVNGEEFAKDIKDLFCLS